MEKKNGFKATIKDDLTGKKITKDVPLKDLGIVQTVAKELAGTEFITLEYNDDYEGIITIDNEEKLKNALKARADIIVKKKKMEFDEKNTLLYGTLIKMIQQTSTLDVCFICDVTGSMNSYVELVKEKLFDILKCIKSETKLKPRFSFIGYRDYCDGSKKYDFINFTEDIEKVEKFIGTIVCTGGGDTCEDVVGAFLEASRLDWKSAFKLVVFFADAPAHGTPYYDANPGDDYPDNNMNKPDLEEVCQVFGKKAHIIAFKCSDYVEKMFNIMKAKHQEDKLFTFSTYELIQGTSLEAKAEFYKIFLTSFSKSLSQSLACGIKKIKSKKSSSQTETWNTTAYSIEEEFDLFNPVFEKCPNFKGKKYEMKIVLKNVDTMKYNVATSEIGSGAFRSAHQIWPINATSTRKFVGKIPNHPSILTEEDIIRELEGYVLASYFAKQFNDKLGIAQIQFLDSIALMPKIKPLLFKGNKYITAETFAEGTFLKYNNNFGWVNNTIKDTLGFKIAQAFSHFTFEESRGYTLIVDIQGVEKNIAGRTELHLTDPALHSHINRGGFGNSNLGKKGIAAFFGAHECNDFCVKLNLFPAEEIIKRFKPEEYSLIMEKAKLAGFTELTKISEDEDEGEKFEDLPDRPEPDKK